MFKLQKSAQPIEVKYIESIGVVIAVFIGYPVKYALVRS